MTEVINSEEIRDAILDKYRKVAESAAGNFKYPTGREGLEALGYNPELYRCAPAGMLDTYCGVGNPFSLGEIFPGQSVLDIGCGGGLDLFIAGKKVGGSGSVEGIDLSPEMMGRARQNIISAGLANARVQQGISESLPYDDCSFDVVISNGVLNMSPDKLESFREIWRVLKPEGWFFYADIVQNEDLPPGRVSTAKDWSD